MSGNKTNEMTEDFQQTLKDYHSYYDVEVIRKNEKRMINTHEKAIFEIEKNSLKLKTNKSRTENLKIKRLEIK